MNKISRLILVIIAHSLSVINYANADEINLRSHKQTGEEMAHSVMPKLTGQLKAENNQLSHIESLDSKLNNLSIDQAEGMGRANQGDDGDEDTSDAEGMCSDKSCNVSKVFSSKCMIERENKMEGAGFTRDEDKVIKNNHGYLDKAIKTVESSNDNFNFLTGGFDNCPNISETINSSTLHTCDQYYDINHNSCFAKQIVEIDPKYTYVCSKKREVKEKQCTDVVKNIRCKHSEGCFAAGIDLKNNSSPDMTWTPDNENQIIKLGTTHKNCWAAKCGLFKRFAQFEIKNKDSIKEFKLIEIGFDDYTRITLNDYQVYAGPNGGHKLEIIPREKNHIYAALYGKSRLGWAQGNRFVDIGTDILPCERDTDWLVTTDIDLKPYLKEGINTINMDVVVYGYGEGWMKIKAQQYCCKEWDMDWEERCDYTS